MKTFAEYMQVREGLLPARPPAKGLSRINVTHMTQAQRRRMAPAIRTAAPVGRIAPSVPAVVPPESVAEIKPVMSPGPNRANVLGSWFGF